MTMRFTVVTILPELIEPALKAGVVGRASEAGTIVVDTVNPRDFTHDRHRTVDDTPYGGGPGMVMKVEPLLAAIAKASEPRPPSSPTGAVARISESPMRSLGARMLEDVKSTLSEIADGLRATPKRGGSVSRSVPDHTIRKLDQDASLDAAAAEDTLAALEQELRQGAEPAPSPSTAPARTSATAGEELLAELEMELGMRPPAADLTTTARARDQKILGPADEEPSTLPGRPPLGPDTPVAGPARPSLGPDTPARPSLGPDTPARPSVGPDTPARPSAGPDTPARPSAGPDNRPETGRPHRILMSPSGRPLTQARVRELATLDHLVLVCGRYEGIDQRVIDTAIDEEISIGDYVLSGGELAALVVIDAVARYVPGVLGEAASTDEESFSAGLLEYPHYTRPQTLPASAVPEALRREALADQTVPAVLQSGNHAAIASWRRQQSLERTAIRRPDLFRQVRMTKADRKLYAPLAARTHLALVHHPVVDRAGAVITTALTNFDIHDLARSTMTYGLAGYHIVTPITSQREKAANIATLWMGDEKGEHRAQALRLVRTAESLDAVIATLATEHAQPPIVVATSAKPDAFAGRPRRTSSELVAEATLSSAPVLLVLGTGWGLAEDLIPSVSRVLAPIEGDSNWNHLSVRSAAAIILDRLFGRPA